MSAVVERGQKRVSNPLEFELQLVKSYLIQSLGNETESSVRAARALNADLSLQPTYALFTLEDEKFAFWGQITKLTVMSKKTENNPTMEGVSTKCFQKQLFLLV